MSDASEIVGVVRDARYNDLRGATPNAANHAAQQASEMLQGLEVRTAGPAAARTADVRKLDCQ